MYLEIFQYDSTDHLQVDAVQQEIRDFINSFPGFTIVDTESVINENFITIHLWYTEQ